MLDLFIGLKRVIKRRSVYIDNSVFRLHWLFTSIMLISCSLIVTSRQYVGDPIDCLQTDDIPSSVLNTYCWIHSTYTVPSAFEKIVGIEVAHPGIERSKGRAYDDAFENELNQQTTSLLNNENASSVITKKVQTVRNNRNLFRSTKYRKYYTYYQWVCFALFIQAILFYLPYFIWKLWEGGLLHAITLGMQLSMISNEEREKKREILNDYLYSHLGCHRAYAYKYFICEFLCFVNVTAQFYLTDWFFDGEFFQYGIKVLRYAKHDPSFSYDPSIFIFPRMTKCTFHSYGFSGDVQRHDALCMLTLNVVNEKIYIFIWFWLALLWLLLIFVLVYRMIILSAWNWRGYFLIKRCTLSHFEDLDLICKNGNIGDWFLFYMLASNLDPLLMREITDEIASRMRDDYKREFQVRQEIMRHNAKFSQNQIDTSLKRYQKNKEFAWSNCIDFQHQNYAIQCSAPPAHHLQFTNSQYLNRDFNACYCLTQTNRHISTSSSVSRKNTNSAKKMSNSKCNEFSHQISTGSCNEQNRDDESASLIDNQTTIVANRCLKDKCLKAFRDNSVDDCTDQQSFRSIKCSQSINKNFKAEKKLKSDTNSGILDSNDRKTVINSEKISCNHSVRESDCTNIYCQNSSGTNSLCNSLSGVCIEFQNNLDKNSESISEQSEIEQTIRLENRMQDCSQVCSQNQTSGYESNLLSNSLNKSNKSNDSNISTNVSDTLDQVSSLERTSEKVSSSPEQPSCTNQSFKRALSLEKAIKGLVFYKNRRKSSSSCLINGEIPNYKIKNSGKKSDRLKFPNKTSSVSNNSNFLFNLNNNQNDLIIDSAQKNNYKNISKNSQKYSNSMRSNSFSQSFPSNVKH